MQSNPPGRVENYTTPALIFGFLNLLWIFAIIWAQFGFSAVLLTAVALNHLITRLDQARSARD